MEELQSQYDSSGELERGTYVVEVERGALWLRLEQAVVGEGAGQFRESSSSSMEAVVLHSEAEKRLTVLVSSRGCPPPRLSPFPPPPPPPPCSPGLFSGPPGVSP